MLNYSFALLLLIHGTIHLVGFARGWSFMRTGISGDTSADLKGRTKLVNIIGVVTCILFVLAMIAYLNNSGWWWVLSIPAIVLSQVLISFYWNDAKFGTIMNVVVLLVVIIYAADWSLNRKIQGDAIRILSMSKQGVNNERLNELPLPVRKWISASGSLRYNVSTVRLKQSGFMRTSEDASWMPFTAKQYINTDEPSFVWEAGITAGKLFTITGYDKYIDGEGHMRIRFLSVVPLADSKGSEINQGSLLRYLAEGMWYPSAMLNEYVQWKEINDSSALASITYGGITASGTFTFNRNNDVVSFSAERYREKGGTYQLQTWLIRNVAYKGFQGVRIPYKSEVSWISGEGTFNWLSMEVEEIEYASRNIW
jgi:hypothetical protein